MKKLLAITIALLLILAGCGKTAPDPAAPEETEPVYRSETIDWLTVGIQIGEEGYYSTYAGAEISYLGDEIVDIVIYDPVLLAYHVSEQWNQGARIYDEAEISEILDLLKAMNNPDLQEIIERLEKGLLLTEAAT
jgi:uncharacterized protein YceK